MIFRLKVKLIFIAIFFLVCIVFYLNKQLEESQSTQSEYTVEEKIYEIFWKLPQKYTTRTTTSDNLTETFLHNIKTTATTPELSKHDLDLLWQEANSWITNHRFVNPYSQNLSGVLHALRHAPIIHSDLDTRGTQLKLLLTLEGDQKVVFKPKWYEPNYVIDIGPVYAGKDRYASEILGFYLSVILGKFFVPVAVERTVSLGKEVIPVSSMRLKEASYVKGNVSCVYGSCLYCKVEEPVCDDGKEASVKGAVLFNVGVKFKSYRSPWQRTYKQGKKALWEEKDDYCDKVKESMSKKRLYDLIDVAIFDFLIQNGDRHHYETFEDNLVYIDNGKGIGNPYRTYVDILAPLYQCCILRKRTWIRLQQLSGGYLREKLEEIPEIKKLITTDHLDAIERRLLLVYATVEYCQQKLGKLKISKRIKNKTFVL